MQPVPQTSASLSELDYAMFFLQPVEETVFETELTKKVSSYRTFLIWMILVSSFILFIIIWLIILTFTKNITQPIETLTDLTDKLTSATDQEQKSAVIKNAQADPIFKEII